jgi:TonB family protein
LGEPVFAISLFALVASSGHVAPHQKVPEPVGSIQGLISADDYPVEALDRNEQGDVGVLIRVGTMGAISDCVVEKSSGSAILDKRTCEIIRQRANYKPARDRHGRAVVSEAHDTITWRIADDVPEPSDPWAATIVMNYAADGQPISCHVEVEGAKAASKPPTCSAFPLPSELRQLGPITQVVVQQRLALGTDPTPALGPDDVIIGRTVLDLSVDEGGKITSCNVADQSAEMRGVDGCKLFSPKRFLPHKGVDGRATSFTATFSYTNYIHVQREAPPTT